jgi:hypothetical protein
VEWKKEVKPVKQKKRIGLIHWNKKFTLKLPVHILQKKTGVAERKRRV